MVAPADDTRAVPSAWPALVALGVIVLLALGGLLFDLYSGAQTHRRASYMVANSVESLVLTGDLRYQAARLQAAHDPAQLAAVLAQVDADLHQYEPLATEPGERDEYLRLREALAQVRQTGPSASNNAAVVASIDHLEDINRIAAYRDAADIRQTHSRELAADALDGGITLTLVLAVALVLVRTLRRQRQLVALHLASLGERQRELEAFSGRVAHDLRGPLSPLRGYADVLSDHESEEIREIAVRLRRAADRMAGIIDEMLSLSVHGKLLAGDRRGRVAEVAREILDELAPELAEAEVTLAVGELAVACSPGVLGQVLRNLVSNAAKYRATDRRLAVRIEAERAGSSVVLSVADNGLGMDEETRAHAFEPLYRAPGASRPGHGLGLSIVKRTVESAGGTVELASTRGEGTRVVVTLPIA